MAYEIHKRTNAGGEIMFFQPILYTALGDSLTAGFGFFPNSFVEDYVQLTEQTLRNKVLTNNYAIPGMTSGQLVYELTNPEVRNSIYHANIITITIGGNDLLHANREFKRSQNPTVFPSTLNQFEQNMLTIKKEIEQIKSETIEPYTLRVIGLYNPFPELSYSQYWIFALNNVLATIVEPHGKFVDIYPIFAYNKNLISFDKLHPNKKGYKAIAQELYKSGYDL